MDDLDRRRCCSTCTFLCSCGPTEPNEALNYFAYNWVQCHRMVPCVYLVFGAVVLDSQGQESIGVCALSIAVA